jgi:asparagine synthase (glutamine-hydrolysing)
MCGIVGIFDMHGVGLIDQALLTQMNQSQLHRGPDEAGLHVEPGIGLGHRRLSIIDLASGQQPLFNEDGSIVVVFNGEIYNFQALMRELTQFGHQFRTHSDTEVIVHAWEQWGERCVEHFRGMFAFGLWDSRQQTLFLARDRLGIKPLYYARLGNGHLIFGSELKSLLVHPLLARELDSLAIEDYFAYGYVPEPRTIFKQACKLTAGHTLCVRRMAPVDVPKQYWDIPFAAQKVGSDADVADELIARLREAVRIRLIAEVPLGAFLSGGVDSSAVVAMMAGTMDEPVNTCSISFGDPAFNESGYAKAVAERYQTRHHAVQFGQHDFDLIDQLANLYDEPFADSSALPTYKVCQLARQRVSVALSGDGGDENLAGYRRYQWHLHEERLRSMLPMAIRRPLFGLMGRIYPKADWAPKPLRAKTTLEALARDSVAAYFHGVSIYSDAMRERLFNPEFRRSLNQYQAVDVLRRHALACPTEHPLSRIQYLDMKTYLVGDILTKVDRASMAHGLEVRVPLLDHQLVEWMSGLPANLKLRGSEGKYIFKKSLAPYLPSDLLYRKKMGFSIPLADWFRGPMKVRLQQVLMGKTLSQTGIFNMSYVQQMLDQHQSGLRDYSAPLWTLLMFESFLRNVLSQSDQIERSAA